MQDKKIFLLGMGCQKGGTTWLHKYLHNHPNCDFGFRKEYHVFDALHLKGEKRFSKKAVRALAKFADGVIEGRIKLKGKAKPSNQLTLVNFYRSVDAYFDYFQTLAHQSEDTRVVGDITPSYAGLSQSVLRQIKIGLEARGFDVRVVFLMRDPVERIYSAARMSLRDRQKAGRTVTHSENETFLSQYKERKSVLRSRYDETITNIDAVFDADKTLYGFYEELFTDGEVQRIVDALGIPFIPPNFKERVNSSAQTEELSPEAAADARAFYGETYDFVAQRFPDTDFKSLWKHY